MRHQEYIVVISSERTETFSHFFFFFFLQLGSINTSQKQSITINMKSRHCSSPKLAGSFLVCCSSGDHYKWRKYCGYY